MGNLLKIQFEARSIRFCKKNREHILRFARKLDLKIDDFRYTVYHFRYTVYDILYIIYWIPYMNDKEYSFTAT